jgi:hypothetical protein
MDDKIIKEMNLGGFPNILIINEVIKKKRETANILNNNGIVNKNINILNIKDILKKKL